MRVATFLLGFAAFAWGAAQIHRYQDFQAAPARITSAPKTPVLGIVVIKRLGLQLPVLDNDSAESLSLSVGHIVGTSPIGSFGNAGIAGHRDTAFRPLKYVRIGDRIETHTGQDSVYVVTAIKVVDPSDTSLLQEAGSPMLTLVTCYPFTWIGSAPRRFVVQAKMLAG